MKIPDALKAQINTLPDTPGVYKYFDKEDKLIYVGKAKSLRKRVSSYFTKTNADRKTYRLVLSIHSIQFTVVNTEYEALLLENNLIKQNQPKYNINLKDDKSYPFIVVTPDRFPKIFATRQRRKDGGTYFGPYASVRTMNTLLELMAKVFTFRTCNLALSKPNVEAGKFKVCLEYHIGNCKGPCVDLQTEEEYNNEVQQAIRILKGHLAPVKHYLKDRMAGYASVMAFEKANWMKQRLDLLENYESRSLVANPGMGNIDVCTILPDGERCFINYLQIVEGLIIHAHTLEIQRKLEETDEELLLSGAISLKEEYGSTAKELLTNLEIDFFIPGLKITVPQVGDKKKLIELSMKNNIYYKHDKEEKARAEIPKVSPNQRILLKLQQDLRLKDYPNHIECFDNSNIQGTNAVAAMVCFKNGVPSKKDYRHFNIKTVVGPDDFASMDEIVTRRYRRMLDEGEPLPKLILIDGGKGQLSASAEALKKLGLYGQIPIIGIAKRLEEIYYPEDPYPLYLDKKGESLILLQKLRDEAHRFGITHHRDQRSKAALQIDIAEVNGLGPKTIERVQERFKTLKRIKDEDQPEIETMIGQAKAKLLMEWVVAQRKKPKTTFATDAVSADDLDAVNTIEVSTNSKPAL